MSATTSMTRETQRTSHVDPAGSNPVNTVSGVATALLPEPAPCGLCDDSMAELSMLLTRADQQDRTASRQMESAADQAAAREESDRVAQLQAKASADESQALWQGAFGIAGGLATAAGGFACNDSPGRQRCDGAGQGLPGLGQVIGGQYKGDADRADANAARDEANAQADIRRYDHAHEDAQAANQSIQKIEQFLDQVQQTENATRLTAATYRG